MRYTRRFLVILVGAIFSLLLFLNIRDFWIVGKVRRSIEKSRLDWSTLVDNLRSLPDARTEDCSVLPVELRALAPLRYSKFQDTLDICLFDQGDYGRYAYVRVSWERGSKRVYVHAFHTLDGAQKSVELFANYKLDYDFVGSVLFKVGYWTMHDSREWLVGRNGIAVIDTPGTSGSLPIVMARYNLRSDHVEGISKKFRVLEEKYRGKRLDNEVFDGFEYAIMTGSDEPCISIANANVPELYSLIEEMNSYLGADDRIRESKFEEDGFRSESLEKYIEQNSYVFLDPWLIWPKILDWKAFRFRPIIVPSKTKKLPN